MENIQKSFEDVLKEPKKFLEFDKEFVEKTKHLLKHMYDFTKREEIKTVRSQALPELIIKDFDLEQIWQQIELQNNSLLPRSMKNINKLLSESKDKLIFKNLESIVPPEENRKEENASDISEDENEANIGENNNNDDEIESDEELSGNDLLLDDNDDDDDNDNDGRSEKKIKSSVVDDQFFKLSEMEEFLKSEEKKMNEPDSGNDSNDDDDDNDGNNDIDLFEDDFDGDDDNDDPAKTAKFKDFFVAKNREARKPKRNKFLENLEDEEDLNNDDEEEEENLENRNEQKSSFELRQERLNRKIAEMEEQAIQEKPWQLKGEITAESRPQNSLLEEVVEFDMTTRPAPVITEKTTLQLEDVIKQRIKDKVFDSVERKAKPVETPMEYKKRLVLDQEKSKESLAQIYEKEYLEQKAALENQEKPEEIPELHKDIETMMKDLFYKLDSLSNFHFTPKPVVPELKIINNLPAITMEEVAPISMSDAKLLAPEEIKKKPKGDIIGKSERTKTDKKRERRKKKLKQKYHAEQKQKQLENNSKKLKTKKNMKELLKQKNINKMDDGTVIKSSKSFFTQLEDEVKTQIKTKTAIKRKHGNDKVVDAKKLKF